MRHLSFTAAALVLASTIVSGQAETSSNDNGPAARQQVAEIGQRVDTRGQLHGIRGSVFTLTHEPIPEIGWPTMTMDLKLLEGAEVGNVKPGDPITITLEKGDDGLYHIRAIGPQ